jgi:hypothetical protein
MTATTNPRLTPRGSTITWGTILLLGASIAGVITLFGSWSWTAGVWLVIAFGALMVVAGLIGGIARAVTKPEPVASTERLTPDSTEVPLP